MAKEKAASRTAAPAAPKVAVKAAPKAAPKVDPSAVPASPTEMAAARTGDGKTDDRPAARPSTSTGLVAASDEDMVPASNPATRTVVPLFTGDSTKKPKGYHELEVVATRGGYYGEGRKRPGAVFRMGFIGKGFLPSWVKLAKGEDTDPEVAQSRQVSRNSTGEEIRADVKRDSGTEVPTYLGGTQRDPNDFRP